MNSNIESFDFFEVDFSKKIIKFKGPKNLLNKPLVIPKGYKLLVGPGIQITLIDEGVIITRSPLEFIGTKLKPIIFKSNNKKGNGLLVLNAEKESTLKNVIFKNMSNINSELYSLPGALNFYNTSLNIESCKFNEINAEDALNIVRSKFKIVDTEFSSSNSDAIDIDFSKGVLKNINIINSI